MSLNDTFTSTGYKFFQHQEAMKNLRNGKGQPIVCHVMSTDVCQHTCAFCSVQHREGDSLTMMQIEGFLDQLVPLGLKAVILSGGGNPILYKCKETGVKFNGLVKMIHDKGLEVGLITNGLKMRVDEPTMRQSWLGILPETLDRLTWIRISMAGLDHQEHEVYVPDVDPSKTVLGFSYVAHDIYQAPEDHKHGKVSTVADVLQLGTLENRTVQRFEDRFDELTEEFVSYCEKYKPRYLRLLPNCLEPPLIAQRCKQLQRIADEVNMWCKQDIVFVQNKPPRPPNVCLLGYVHPVLNCDGFIYPCDSVVLNEAAGHKFDSPWHICRWDEIGKLYEKPIQSLIDDPKMRCPGCVFPTSNDTLEAVWRGDIEPTPSESVPEHVNFI